MKKILIGLFAAGAAYGQVALTMTTDNPNPSGRTVLLVYADGEQHRRDGPDGAY